MARPALSGKSAVRAFLGQDGAEHGGIRISASASTASLVARPLISVWSRKRPGEAGSRATTCSGLRPSGSANTISIATTEAPRSRSFETISAMVERGHGH